MNEQNSDSRIEESWKKILESSIVSQGWNLEDLTFQVVEQSLKELGEVNCDQIKREYSPGNTDRVRKAIREDMCSWESLEISNDSLPKSFQSDLYCLVKKHFGDLGPGSKTEEFHFIFEVKSSPEASLLLARRIHSEEHSFIFKRVSSSVAGGLGFQETNEKIKIEEGFYDWSIELRREEKSSKKSYKETGNLYKGFSQVLWNSWALIATKRKNNPQIFDQLPAVAYDNHKVVDKYFFPIIVVNSDIYKAIFSIKKSSIRDVSIDETPIKWGVFPQDPTQLVYGLCAPSKEYIKNIFIVNYSYLDEFLKKLLGEDGGISQVWQDRLAILDRA